MSEPQEDDDRDCPQCRSQKIEDQGPLRGFRCRYCTNEWDEITAEEVENVVAAGDEFELVDKFETPLPVVGVKGRVVRLEGRRGGEYKLKIVGPNQGKLRRKKGSSERNQFGSKWTNPKPVEFVYLDSD